LTTKDTSLLNSIGTAQMEQELQRTVKGFENIVEQQEKEMKEQSGVESSISQEDVHEYLQQVVEEVSKVKKKEHAT
jgi:Tfp pilus assembly PilM family ATPase